MMKGKELEEDKVYLYMIIIYWIEYMNYINDL